MAALRRTRSSGNPTPRNINSEAFTSSLNSPVEKKGKKGKGKGGEDRGKRNMIRHRTGELFGHEVRVCVFSVGYPRIEKGGKKRGKEKKEQEKNRCGSLRQICFSRCKSVLGTFFESIRPTQRKKKREGKGEQGEKRVTRPSGRPSIDETCVWSVRMRHKKGKKKKEKREKKERKPLIRVSRCLYLLQSQIRGASS